jgi:hypothetical protein
MFNEPRIKERKSAAARPPHSSVPPSLRLGRPYFMLIFRLENADSAEADGPGQRDVHMTARLGG